MCEEPQPAPQVAGESEHGSPPASAYASAFFSRSKQFTVMGGTFTNAPPNFRMIPMGDLDLRHEVRQKAGSITTRRRRVYAARIHGSNTCMMAIIYQGYNAEEILVPHLDFWQQSDDSHERLQHWSEYTAWIRISTGVLSIELTPPESWTTALDYYHSDFQPSSTSLLTLPPMSEIISSLSLKDYHYICDRHLSRDRNFTAPTKYANQTGSICHASGSEFNKSFEVIDDGWLTEDPVIQDHWFSIEEGTSILENGWIRVNSACVVEGISAAGYTTMMSARVGRTGLPHFHSLDIKSNLEDYGECHLVIISLIYAMECCLQLLGPIENLRPGYLFFCPFAKLEQICQHVCGSRLPAYWSLDSSGREPSVYAGIRPFHEARGFDPDSQDVGMHLGYLLFQLACRRDVLLLHLRKTADDDDIEFKVVSGGEDHGALQQKSVELSGPFSGTESFGVHVQEVEDAEFEGMTADAAASDAVRDPCDLAIKVGLCLEDESPPDSEAQLTRSNEGASDVPVLFHPFDKVEISRSWNVIIA
ncbi:hypothetical protein B0H14DRAFT_2680856, partial [Mycena olivaceomarginata]